MKLKKKENKFLPKYQNSAAVADPYLMAAQKVKGVLSNVGNGISTAGNILYQSANSPDDYSNINQSTLGMGLQGMVGGAKFGGLPGALLGGIGGAALGFYTAKKNNIEREAQDYMKEQAMIKNATFGVDRGYFEKSGFVNARNFLPVAEFSLKEYNNKKIPKLSDGGETKEKFENKETFYSQMIRDKNDYIIPQMIGQTSEKDGVPIVHIQAEKGEKAIIPDGSIFDVKAEDKHEKMHKDYVTDVFPEGVYIAGARKSSNIKKKSAEKEVLGHTPLTYNEFKIGKEPEEVKLSDIFKKNVHTVAELADIVRNKFKLSDREKDPFTTITNEENKVGRIPYLAKIIEMREKNKKRGAKEDTPVEMMKGGKVKRYQTSGGVYPPLFVTPGGGIGGSIPISFDDKFGNNTDEPYDYSKMIKDYQTNQNKFIDKYKQEYSDYYKYARGANAGANLLGMAGTALQSSEITPAYKGTNYLDDAYAKIPQFLRERGVEQSQRPIYSIARNLSQLGPTSTVMSMMAPAISRSVDSANRTYQSYIMDDINQDRKRAMALQGIQDYNTAQDANVENMRRRMDNYKISQIAGYGGQTLTGDASLRGRQVRDMMALDGQGIQNEFSANAQLAMLKQQKRMLDGLNNKRFSSVKDIEGVTPYKTFTQGIIGNNSNIQQANKLGDWANSFRQNWGEDPFVGLPSSPEGIRQNWTDRLLSFKN